MLELPATRSPPTHPQDFLRRRDSAEHESFSPALEGRIEHPHYTRPPSFRGWGVPEVLLSGDHGAVDRWRVAESERRTEAAGDPETLS